MDHLFGDCKTQPLHTMGLIQSHGALLAINSTNHTVEFCSANIAQFLGREAQELLGVQALSVFGDRWPEILKLCSEKGIYRLPAVDSNPELDIAGHCRGQHLVLEFEITHQSTNHWWNYAERVNFLARLEQARTLLDCRRLIVRLLFERTGFDRVMLYRFYADMHGKVTEERCKEGVKSYLGLHFPADDIPPNAHQFYTQNWQRLIADVESENVPVLGYNADPASLDLTSSMLRAVHPVHIQYLKNMEVASSFSVSLVVKKKLYGLVACHNGTANPLGLQDRLAYEEIGRMVSIHLESLLALREKDQRASLIQQLADIKKAVSTEVRGVGIARNMGLTQELLSASAAWLNYDGNDYFSGPVPQRSELEPLYSWFQTLDRDQVSSFTSLPEQLASNPAINSKACGILFLPLDKDNFLALLRPELVKTITWAGQPPDENQPTLTPRNSFNAWVEQTRGKANGWTEMETEFASKLRVELITSAT